MPASRASSLPSAQAQLVKEMAAAIEGHEPYQGREVMGETDALNRLREI